MKGTSVILVVLMCSALTSSKQDLTFKKDLKDVQLCAKLQETYLKQYSEWARETSYYENQPSKINYEDPKMTLHAIKTSGCDTDSLPLITPVPEFIQPTAQQLTCVDMTADYLVKYHQWQWSYSFVYEPVALSYVYLSLQGCPSNPLPRIYPLPSLPNLALECTQLRENYVAAYATWVLDDDYKRLNYFSAEVALLALHLKSCKISDLELISPMPIFRKVQENKKVLGRSFVFRRPIKKRLTNDQ